MKTCQVSQFYLEPHDIRGRKNGKTWTERPVTTLETQLLFAMK